MPKENLETKARKAVLNIEDKLTYIGYTLKDISMKLCHLVKEWRDYHKRLERNDYYRQF